MRIENEKDPKILTFEGDEFMGTISEGAFPGKFLYYVDYTHKYTDYDNR